jgi:hypothetical protein
VRNPRNPYAGHERLDRAGEMALVMVDRFAVTGSVTESDLQLAGFSLAEQRELGDDARERARRMMGRRNLSAAA